jgi:zinc protease
LGRAAIEALEFEPLDFEQPEVETHRVDGVDVLVLEDHTLPLVTAYAYFRGGYGLFDRQDYAAATGLPALMRYGGTTTRSPDQVDEIIDDQAFLLSFGSGGGSVTSSVNALARTLESAMDLWGDMLAEPGFDDAEIAAWRARQLESVLRRADDPALLAFSELNRLLYGDHPIGWEMTEADLAPERLTSERIHAVHRRVVCRDNLVLGLTGDVAWDDVRPLVQGLLDRIPACATTLPEAPIPDIRRQPGVFLIEKELDQAVIVMAHPTSVRLDDDDAYYAAMIGNSILGGGGFSSRILGRVRTQEGYAYSAASLWTTPRRHDGIVGATTRTRPENVVPAIEVILETMGDLRAAPPTPLEVSTTVDRIVNGFVFNFDTPGQIVARSMAYLAQDLPEDWLERYWNGVQEVRAEDVQRVFAQHLDPGRMSILVVGDPQRIGREALARLGPVTVIDPS